ncbi:hypothetical protein ACQ4PT_054830 [Festuca glaucescens]
MAEVQGKMMDQGAEAVTGGQEPLKADGAKDGEAPEAAPAPKTAAANLPHHRRSKSASSGRNLETCDHGGAASHGVVEQRFHRPPQNPPDPRKSSRATEGSPVHPAMRRDHRPSASSPNHRVSLENDVSQLQLHLHQERSIRIMLDRAIGRASSTLSPGHRHFPAQTKELIAEIELLEEEIANREQHVLTLYRSIFDQCVSGPSSGQSSGISSPAHAKSWFESILSTAMRKRCADEKQLIQLKFGLPDCQPLVLFALCTGASSDPMLKVYTAKNVADELERAKREFLQAAVVVRKSRKVFLPRLVERYAKEAGLPVGDGILAWARDNVDGRAAQDTIQRCAVAAAAGGRRRASQAFEWLPYNARFRYAIARSMVDKQAAAVLA